MNANKAQHIRNIWICFPIFSGTLHNSLEVNILSVNTVIKFLNLELFVYYSLVMLSRVVLFLGYSLQASLSTNKINDADLKYCEETVTRSDIMQLLIGQEHCIVINYDL